jgi:hypothetical protein
MTVSAIRVFSLILIATGLGLVPFAAAQATGEQAGVSRWGPTDEIGALNMMTQETRLEILSRVSSGKVYDLSVEYFLGMPSFSARGAIPPTSTR